MRRPIARDQNQRKRAVSSQVGSWVNFTPASLRPVVWLDATDTATITESGGAVSQWNDKSGNGYNVAQATGTDQPTTGTRTLNGRNVIDFDGTNDFMASAFDITQLTSSKAVTVVIVASFDVTLSTRALFGASRAATVNFGGWTLSTGFEFLQSATSDTLFRIGSGDQVPDADDFRAIIVDVANTSAKIYALTASASPAIQASFVNGADGADTFVAGGTLAVANFLSLGSSNHRIIVGARTTNNSNTTTTTNVNFLDGFIGELVVFDRALTTNERSGLRDYLDAKWAIY